MTRAAHHRIPAVPTTQLRSWAGYAAAAWALVFAGPHFYWGVGGAVGLDTALNREIVEGRSGWFLTLNWAIGIVCVTGGVVALATVRPWAAGCLPGSCAASPGSGSRCSRPAPSTSTSSSGSA